LDYARERQNMAAEVRAGTATGPFPNTAGFGGNNGGPVVASRSEYTKAAVAL
jgi:hypothetical protein